MSSSKLFTIILFSLTLALILQTSFGDSPLLGHICFEIASAFQSYEVNVEALTQALIVKTPVTGFAVSTVGDGTDTLVYGLALCRGDVSTSDCEACVSEATNEILNLCFYPKGAIIWYDYCMFKFLDTNFFGNIDNTNKFFLENPITSSDPANFNSKADELMSQLAQNASVNPNFYATGELMVDESQTLYGLTQCTGDLRNSDGNDDCLMCLNYLISKLPICCDGREGARGVSGSCNFRYEIYPFVNE